ncbi:hypothetical protein BB558_003174 [Smittium angustum]|uniref:enoyl-[acyl-carrier-protein] reductase n=1 Tax=Smittium angustum TaxID=133377 RepID=A0A2U1J6S5_SMIAN|nr:hypothetical protein BB558_003174 [Smittium angustum]
MSQSSNNIVSRAVIVEKLGNPAEVAKVYDIFLGDLTENKVLVQALVSSVNPVDNLIIAGLFPVPFVAQDFSTIEQNSSQTKVNGTIPGDEGVGRVVKIGQNVSVAMNGTLEVGDWVVPMDLGAFGTWADYYHADPKALVVIKNKTGLTPESLSSITINLPTAYGLLKDIIPLKAGEYIIQNGANSEVGKYIIQMAHIWGIRTVNVIRDRSNYKALENELKSLGADIVIKDTEIKSDETVKLLSSLDAPIKLAINCVGGNSAILLADHLCEDGTYVVYGSMTGEDVPVPYPYLFLLYLFKMSQSSNNIVSRAVIVEKLGNPAEVAKVYNVSLGDLPENKVLVQALVSSVNPVDNLIIAGLFPVPFLAQDFSTIKENSSQTKVNGTIPGGEGIGKVIKIGQNASVAMNGTLEVGDWVVPMDLGVYGTWSDYYHADPKALVVIKNKTGLTPESLSSITINLPTAYGLLKDIITLKAGEYIIQNGANSEVGKYIIQLAHIWGIRTVNLIRDRSNYKELENELKSLGADIVIKDTEIKSDETVKLLSSLNAPIKLAINCVGGNSAILLADHLCEEGTYEAYGSMTGEDVPVPYPYLVAKNISFRGFNIFRYYGKNPTHVWMERWNKIMNLIREGKIQKTSTRLVEWESYGEGSLETLQKKVQDAITFTSKVSFVFN